MHSCLQNPTHCFDGPTPQHASTGLALARAKNKDEVKRKNYKSRTLELEFFSRSHTANKASTRNWLVKTRHEATHPCV